VSTTHPNILWDVVEDHLDEAEFLIGQWLVAARSPRFSLELLQTTLERRLDAQLDGLAVGGSEVADGLLWATLEDGSIGSEAFFTACGLGLLADETGSAAPRLIDLLNTTDKPKVRNGLRNAFLLGGSPATIEAVRLALYASDSPPVQAAILAVLAARRIDPGPILGPLLERDAEVRAPAVQALAAAPDSARGSLLPRVEQLLADDAPGVRAAARRTGLIWNLEPAWRSCAAQAQAGAPDALLYLAMLDGAAALPWFASGLASPERRPAVLFALGFTGLPEAVDLCLPWLDDPEIAVARLAGEAVGTITGLELDDSRYATRRKPQPAQDLPPLEDDLREDLMPTPVDMLPVPIAGAIRDWWSERRSAFTAGRRYLYGHPFTVNTVQAALLIGPLRPTGALACELAIRSAGETQLPALHLGYPSPTLPPRLESALHRPPRWR